MFIVIVLFIKSFMEVATINPEAVFCFPSLALLRLVIFVLYPSSNNLLHTSVNLFENLNRIFSPILYKYISDTKLSAFIFNSSKEFANKKSFIYVLFLLIATLKWLVVILHPDFLIYSVPSFIEQILGEYSLVL